MTKSLAFKTLADVLTEMETMGLEVEEVAPQRSKLLADGDLAVTVDVTFPVLNQLTTIEGVDITLSDGSISGDRDVTLAINISIPGSSDSAVSTYADGSGVTTAESTTIIQTNGADNSNETNEIKNTSSSDKSSTPPHRDPEKLQAVYESCETFREMTDALGVDVTPETVRQQMIKHSIHEPETTHTLTQSDESSDGVSSDESSDGVSSDESSDGVSSDESSSEAISIVSDSADPNAEVTSTADQANIENGGLATSIDNGGFDLSADVTLPDNITMPDVIKAVKRANTVYEASKYLGLTQDKTRDLLTELNVLDLVLGRISTKDTREISDEDIIDKIQKSAS